MRRALELALEQGLGRETAVIYGNLAGAVWSYEGPPAALDASEDGIAFCERRGIAEVAPICRAGNLASWPSSARHEQALAEAGPVADRLEATGDIAFVVPRALQLRLLAEVGAPSTPPTTMSPLLAAARDVGQPAVARLRSPPPPSSCSPERDARSGARAAAGARPARPRPNRARCELPALLRVALALGDATLARRLAGGVEPLTPATKHALASAEPSSPRPTATTPTPPDSTPTPPNAGTSSGTSPSVPTPSSGKAAA